MVGKKEILPNMGAKVDLGNIRNIIKKLTNVDISDQEIIDSYLPETVMILEEKWQAVEALAQVLEERWSGEVTYITGDEVVRILEQSLGKKL